MNKEENIVKKEKFSKKKLMTFGLIGLFAIMLVSAAVLTYYGQITQTINVDQAVVLTCPGDNCGESISGFSGDTLMSNVYTLDNNADSSREVDLVSTYDPEIIEDEIITSYLKMLDYDETIIIDGYSIPAAVTVKDLGDSVEWTIDMDETVPAFANGHAQYGLIISTDKVHPAFQVHSNDGTCLEDKGGWVAGTHLYSAWDDTILGNYNGWNTGGEDCEFTNTPVVNEGIVAIGEYSTSVNTDTIFIITIPKTHLGYEEFYWAMQLMGNTVDTQYPSEWVKWSGDASTFDTATIGETLASQFTMDETSGFDFVIVNKITDLSDGIDEGTITTEAVPSA